MYIYFRSNICLESFVLVRDLYGNKKCRELGREFLVLENLIFKILD